MTSHDNRRSKHHCPFLTRRQVIRGTFGVAASFLLPRRDFSLYPNSSITSCNPAISRLSSIDPQGKSAVVQWPITFENAARQSGVTFVLDNSASPHRLQPETAIAGVGIFDYNNDGLMDLFFVNGAHLPDMDKRDPKYWNRLYHNNGDGTFADVTEKAGVQGIYFGMGVAAADYDNDGWVDLFVTGVNGCQLFHNNGDGTFTDVSEKSGIGKYIGKGMGVAFADFNGDGYTDIFVSNDTYRNFLFRNNGNGTFDEVGVEMGVAYNQFGKSIAGMGTDFRDVDNDGRPDIFVVGMAGDTFPLFRNTGKDFEDITGESGIAAATARFTGWGAGIADLDNDGWKDLFVSCAAILDNSEEVIQLPSKLPNIVLRNTGHNRFVDVSAQAGASFGAPGAHRGAAMGDLNNDGRMDVVVTNQHALPEIWINRTVNSNHWLLVKLVGARSNRDGLGARLKVTLADNTSCYNHATTSTGYGASSDPRVHFGLGSFDHADKLEIWWPSGIHQTLTKVRGDQILVVHESVN